MATTINVNGKSHAIDVDGDTPLLWVLRDVLGMTGTKFGCGKGLCGACTIHLDGVATRSCLIPIESVGNSAITTIEAIGASPSGRKVQEAWLAVEVVQCGYCQSGQIMSAAALLASNPHPREGFGYSVIDLGNLGDGGLIQQAGGPLASRDLLERGEYRK
jgi:isoquinoline 1-oxidoreductase alpha subunit